MRLSVVDDQKGCSFIGMTSIICWNKIEKIHYSLYIFILTITSCAPKPQFIKPNNYGLKVVEKKGTYRYIVQADSSHRLVALNQILQPFTTAFYYETTDNFTKQKLYRKPKAYLRSEAAQALKKVQDTLHSLGLGLKIFDAYRPYTVTKKMWEIVPDDRYAANPANGSGHNRGVAVDLTLVNLATGAELAMPTPFDSFSDTAHHDFMQLSTEILANRKLLKQTMEQYGFVALSTEWWHYYLPDPKRYELLDLSFKQLRKLVK